MSRGRWLVFGSTLTFMSCNDGTSKSPITMDAAGSVAAQSDVVVDGLGTSADAAVDTNGADDAAGDDAADDSLDLGTRADVEKDGAGADASDDASNDSEDAIDDRTGTDGSSGDHLDRGDASDSRGDATPDVALDGGNDATYFPCCLFGSTPPSCPLCDRRTQLCNLTTTPLSSWPDVCFTIDGGALGNFPEQCMPAPSCACIAPFYASCKEPFSTYSCQENAGGVMISCNGCYGSPPVRWERRVDPPMGASAQLTARRRTRTRTGGRVDG